MTCFYPDYWIVLHSATFFLLLVIFSTVWMLNNLSVKIKANGDNVTIIDDVVQCPNLLEHIQTKEKIDLNFIEAKENAEEIVIRSFKSNFSEFIPTISLSIIFFVYWMLVRDLSSDFTIAPQVTFTNSYQQSVFAGFFYSLFIGYFLMALWFRLFKKQKSEVSCMIVLFAIGITLIMTVVGILYTVLVLTNTTSGTQTLAMTSFVIGPIFLFTIISFYSIWRSHDYKFFSERPSVEEQKEPEVERRESVRERSLRYRRDKTTRIVEEIKDDHFIHKSPNELKFRNTNFVQGRDADSSLEAEESSVDHDGGESENDAVPSPGLPLVESFNLQPKKQNPWIKKKKSKPQKEEEDQSNVSELSNTSVAENPGSKSKKDRKSYIQRASIKPKSRNDCAVLVLFWLNVISMVLYFIINMSVFTDKYLIVLIVTWIFNIEIGLFFCIKLYRSHYTLCHTWQIISFIAMVVLLINSLIFFSIEISDAQKSNSTSWRNTLLVYFFILHIIVPGLAAYTLGYLFIKERTSKNTVWKRIGLLFTFLVLIAFAVVAFVYGEHSVGATFCVVGCTCIVKAILESKCLYYKLSENVRQGILVGSMILFLTIACLLVFILDPNRNHAAVTLFGIIFLSFTVYFGLQFIYKIRYNKLKSQSMISVYTRNIFPALKYVPDLYGGHGTMKMNNSELMYFCLSDGSLFIWSLIAGTLLDDEYRYIGLSISAASMVFAIIYFNDKVWNGTTMEYSQITQISKVKYSQFQATALNYRLQLNEQARQIQKTIAQKAKQSDEALERKQEILRIYDEWIVFGNRVEDVIGGLFRVENWISTIWRKITSKPYPSEFQNAEVNQRQIHLDKADTARDFKMQTDLLIESYERADVAYYNHILYYAYLRGQMQLYVNQLEKELKAVMNKIFKDMDHVMKLDPDYDEFINMDIYRFDELTDNQKARFDEIFQTYKEKKISNFKRDLEKEREQIARMKNRQIWIKSIVKDQPDHPNFTKLEPDDAEDFNEEDHLVGHDIRSKKVQQSYEKYQLDFDKDNDDDQHFIFEGDKILQNYTNKIYKDKEFTGANGIFVDPKTGYQDDPTLWQKVKWERIHEINASDGKLIGSRAVLFGKDGSDDNEEGIGCNDILQGELGDCWLLSAIAGLAFKRPDLLSNLFHPQTHMYNKNGIYLLRFYKMGEMQIVQVDDRFPVNNENENLFMSPNLNDENTQCEFWSCLIEKAYAKLHGSYERIEGGQSSQGYADLTGGIPRNLNFDSEEFQQMKNVGAVWALIKNSLDEGHLLGISSKGTSDDVTNPQGIVEGHAYTLLDAQEVDGHQLLQIRNPWGEKEWDGEWSDKDNVNWTTKRRQTVKNRQQLKNLNSIDLGPNDGVFWISLTDVYLNFDSIQLCYLYQWNKHCIRDEWKGETAAGSQNEDDYHKNPQYKLTCKKENARVIIHLQQPDPDEDDEQQFMAFHLYKNFGCPVLEGEFPVVAHDSGDYIDKRDIILDDVLVRDSNEYTLIPSLFDPEVERKVDIVLV